MRAVALKHGVVAAVLVASVSMGLGIYQAVRSHALGTEVTMLRAAIDELNAARGISFRDRSSFDAAVAASVNVLVEQRKRADTDALYARYEAAPETTEGGRHIYGNPTARFTLLEFSDLECPYCKQFHETPKQIVDASKGAVSWQWKHLPLDFHDPAAHKEAVASECIADQRGNRGFWAFVGEVFEHTRGNGQGVDLAVVASRVGADLDALRECLASGRHDETVRADVALAQSHGATGTPATFVVDNTTGRSVLLGGSQPVQAFLAVMQKLAEEHQAAGSAED